MKALKWSTAFGIFKTWAMNVTIALTISSVASVTFKQPVLLLTYFIKHRCIPQMIESSHCSIRHWPPPVHCSFTHMNHIHPSCACNETKKNQEKNRPFYAMKLFKRMLNKILLSMRTKHHRVSQLETNRESIKYESGEDFKCIHTRKISGCLRHTD